MIQLTVTRTQDNKHYIQITQQDEKRICFKASNGWELVTCEWPEIHKDYKTFYLRGYNKEKNNKKVLVSKETLKKIIEAVNEYNEKCKKKIVKKVTKTKKKEVYVILDEPVHVNEDGDCYLTGGDFNSVEDAEKYIRTKIKRNFNGHIYKRIATVDIKETKKIDVKIVKL